MGAGSSKSKILLAMDFDNTVINANTDVEIQGAAEEGRIPPEIRAMKDGCWTDFMQSVFELLHKQGKGEREYRMYIERLPFASGMKSLIKAAGLSENIETIILSDSNSLFIKWILDKHGLTSSVDEIFTNPAHFDENGCLRIAYYHKQDWCELSAVNLCKGAILEEFVKRRAKDDVKFSRIVYVGDGKNDLCPAARLNSRGVICARAGYRMESVLRDGRVPMKAQVHFWKSGRELFEFLELEPPPENDSDDD